MLLKHLYSCPTARSRPRMEPKTGKIAWDVAPSLLPLKSTANSEEALPGHQKAMLAACEFGDLYTLQQLFQTHNVKQGGLPVYWVDVPLSGPPETYSLITTAVAKKQILTLQFLLVTYPKIDLWHGSIIRSVLDNKDLETFKILHAHSPNLVNYEWNPMTTILTEACRGGSDYVPFIHYLLDNGADMYSGWWAGSGPIQPALMYSQPQEIIEKMVERSNYLSPGVVDTAIRYQRIDALKVFFRRRDLDRRVNEPQKLLDIAHETKNEEVIGLVENYAQKLESQAKGKGKALKLDEESTRRGNQQATGEKRLTERREKPSIETKKCWQFWQSEKDRVKSKELAKELPDGDSDLESNGSVEKSKI